MRRAGVSVKRRLGILFDVWEEVIGEWERAGSVSRERVVEILRSFYEREGVSPLKGAANPPDIYEKEMASLYVVGKHALGLDSSHPELFDAVFRDEVRYEEAIKGLLSDDPERARLKVEAILGGVPDDNTAARMLRLKLTEVYFGFADPDTFKTLLRRFVEAFPEHRRLASKYAKFYIAFRIADAIQKGEVRDRITKEAMKQAMALEFSWLEKVLPDDSYIRKIAEEVFHIPPRILDLVLPASKRREKEARRGARRQ
jgi:hypothetical protein